MADSKSEIMSRLKVVLQDGYNLIGTRGLYKTPRIPRNTEKGFNPRANNFNRALAQQTISNDFHEWENELLKTFEYCGLSWHRFRMRTEDIEDSVGYSDAFFIKQKIKELDTIVNQPDIFESYRLPGGNVPVTFRDGKLVQGTNEHQFKESHVIGLLNYLWKYRRIIDPQGDELKPAEPQSLSEVLKILKLRHERFDALVKNINSVRARNGVKIWVRNPRGSDEVYLQLVQDYLKQIDVS